MSLRFEPAEQALPAGGAAMRHRQIRSPLGELVLSGGRHLASVELRRSAPAPTSRADGRAFPDAADQLGAYFAGELRDFDLCVAPSGTHFQMLVWLELASVPYASTISYQELAQRIGRPSAARAVGHAVARNPLLILVPCHRVLPADGRLGNFAAGPARKEALLKLEGAR